MVTVLKHKKVLYQYENRIAQLCVQTIWNTKGSPLKTPLGVFSSLHTSDKKCVDRYKKQGVKFSEDKNYFVRIMDLQEKCVIVLDTYKKPLLAEKQYKSLQKWSIKNK